MTTQFENFTARIERIAELQKEAAEKEREAATSKATFAAALEKEANALADFLYSNLTKKVIEDITHRLVQRLDWRLE